MIYDCFSFSGEYDMLEIRFNLLSPFVDKFVIVEGIETFSGNPKILYWAERDKERFEEWENRVVYGVVVDYQDEEIRNQISERSAYVDRVSFQRAFYQKESIRKFLQMLSPKDEDVVYYGDVDEIWKPQKLTKGVHKLRQLAYSYYLNNRSPEDWRGTIVTTWGHLKDKCLNDMRANPIEEDILNDAGWHFTNLGGLEAIKRKIASYDHQEANIPFVVDGLEERLKNNIDFLGRGFRFWLDESALPEYIVDNKEYFAHKGLWKITN